MKLNKFDFKNKSKRGFTLIELLVVIAIIGILSSIVLVVLNNSRIKSKDARIISTVRQLKNQFELDFSGGDYTNSFKANGLNQLTINSSSATGITAFTSILPDAVTNAPSGYTNTSIMDGAVSPGVIYSTVPGTPGTGVAGGTVANSVILVVTNGIASGAGAYTTKPTAYSIWGRLSSNNYFCIDSAGNAKNGTVGVTPVSAAADITCH